MTSSGTTRGVTTKLDDDDHHYPVAVAAAEPWPGTEKKKKKMCMCRRVLLVGSLVTLPLLAFFVFSRENASMAWLQIAVAKLTAMNHDGGAAGTYVYGHPCISMSFACYAATLIVPIVKIHYYLSFRIYERSSWRPRRAPGRASRAGH